MAASLPILACWGLPISLMSFLGNLFFTPFLTVFLLLSTITFFTEIFHIPNGIFIHALSKTTSLWESLLSYGSKSWLFGIAQPKKALAILLIILALILTIRFTLKIISKVILLALIVCTTYFVLHQVHHYNWPRARTIVVPPKKFKKLRIAQLPNKKIEIIDNKLFHKERSPEKFVMYSLKPYLIKKFGIVPIEKILISVPSHRTFRAIKELGKTFEIKNVTIVD